MSKRRYRKIISFGLILFLIFAGAIGYLYVNGCNIDLEDPGVHYLQEDADITSLSDATVDKIVDNMVENMSLDDKVGQMFMVNLSQLSFSKTAIKNGSLNKKAKKYMELYHVGGVVMYSTDFTDYNTSKALINSINESSSLNLFIAADEEGSSINSLSTNSSLKVTALPTPSLTSDYKYSDIKSAYAKNAAGLLSLGVNVNLAPLADIKGNVADNKSLDSDTNCFSTDVDRVSKLVKASVKGIENSGVAATVKHFPGQGAMSTDTHIASADAATSIDELREKELLPFKSGIDAGASFVMMSHESLSSITGDTAPACMSSVLIQDVLRQELGFDGIVITNSMNMKAITDNYTSAQAAVNAVKAGVDVIMVPLDLEAAYDGVIDAVKSGDIEESRIDESVKRILKCKLEKGILPLNNDLVEKACLDSYEDIGNLEQSGEN